MAISTPHASRRDFIRISSTLGLAAGIAATLAACGGGDGGSGTSATTGATGDSMMEAPASSDGTITAGISYELGTNGYDPMTTTAALTVAANWHTMEGLTELDPASREVYAALGAELPTAIDDTTYEVTLREGAVFSDGTPVTTDDVVFSFDRVRDPANKSLYAQFITFVDTVTAKDDTTVTITTKYPFSLIAERLSVVKIVPRAAAEADPAAFDLNPVGTGPYTMTDNGAGSQKVVFERNEGYTGPKPALAKDMVWQILPDDTTRTNAITSNTVQAIDAVPVANLTSMQDPIKVAAQQGFGLLFIMFNNSVLTDVKARQAVLYALDYASICETGLGTLATPASCFVHEDHPAYKKASTVYTYDVEKAKSLLAEAGVTEINLLCTDHGWFSNVRPIVRQNLEALGVTVNYQEKKSSEVYGYIDSNEGAWDVMLAPGDPSVFGSDADLLLRWWYGGDVWTDTRMHWKGTEAYTKVQEMLDEAVKLTGDKQIAKWQEVFNLLSDEVPLYPLLHRKTPTAYNGETLQGFKPIALTGLSFAGVGTTATA
ncbi:MULTISPECIES: ABC transporter substrate-binding protein [Actinomyces]|uniref:ABC transporter substrate-binding protein n=1 Tax=Actinomyces respiraculi TaxID=2744574 RepID=A0A7T0PV22_9ACTO|nr:MULTISPECIES: ABC transporter substrate-binding protein [Actinomyces]QPL04821.1 ABC transporter substrate-binding protein [Actinomyces respiraculi]